MTHNAWRNLIAALLFTAVVFFASGGVLAAGHPSCSPAATQSTESATPAQSDRTPWRNLHRKMSKDDVRKLLGEPLRVSVSRFYEAWDYPRGTVIFDGKGRLDAWSEL
jgi:outer membrane protein assembly factor BamE (lipoprotein component of BamABCDE complex)